MRVFSRKLRFSGQPAFQTKQSCASTGPVSYNESLAITDEFAGTFRLVRRLTCSGNHPGLSSKVRRAVTRLRSHVVRLTILSVCGWVSVCFVSDLSAQSNLSRGKQQAAAIEMLVTQMDTNKNGYIDPTEMKGLAKKYAERGGLNVKRSHQISKVVEVVRNKGKQPKEKAKSDTERKVPDFSSEPIERLGVPDFSPTGEERMTVAMMKRKFSPSVMSQVERTMTRNDKDKSGVLDAKEIARSRWSNPTWQESDTNKDGKLSRLELAYRYQGREEEAKKKKSTSTSASRGRTTSKTSTSSRGRLASTRNDRSSRLGRTSSTSKPSSSSSKNRRGFNSGSDAYKRYSEGLMRSYDKDKDGKLSKKELEEMRRPPKDADKNRDGFVDQSELLASVEQRSGVKSSERSKSTSKPTRGEKLRRPSSKSYNEADSIFGGKDINHDRQLQMWEFSDEWDDDVVEEFEEKDLNGDGVITEAEWKG